jgi:peptidoglycan/xylan/chitin deacetylase (PgdA/CDA1 family)
MTRPGTVYLMYHELQPIGRELGWRAKGDRRYVVAERDFRRQLAWLNARQFGGLSVGEALGGQAGEGPALAITFDDGCETDALTAAPLLSEAGFRATFYVVVGWLGKPGYLAPAQVRELRDSGFEIGCHSMTHRYLTDLGPECLRAEVVEARRELEQILGQPVDHFSCPGGRWNARVARLAQTVGYRSCATSRIGMNVRERDRFSLKRVAVHRGTGLDDFGRLCRGELLGRQVRQTILDTGKAILGNSAYGRMRSLLLRGR